MWHNINSGKAIEQYNVTFFEKLITRSDDFTENLRLSQDQQEYLFEKDTSKFDEDADIKIELNEGVVNYLESFRKGLISRILKKNMAGVTADSRMGSS